VRIFLMLSNFVFCIMCVTMMAVGITTTLEPYLAISFESYQIGYDNINDVSCHLYERAITEYTIFTTVAGLLLTLVTLFGVVSAGLTNVKMLLSYIGILCLMVIGETVLIVVVMEREDTFASLGEEYMAKCFKEKLKFDVRVDAGNITSIYGAPLEPVDTSWAEIQFNLRCCGLDGFEDYKGINWTKCGSRTCPITSKVPLSCCRLPDDYEDIPDHTSHFVDVQGCMASPLNASSVNREGCSAKVLQITNREINKMIRYGTISILTGVTVTLVYITLATSMICLRPSRTSRRVSMQPRGSTFETE